MARPRKAKAKPAKKEVSAAVKAFKMSEEVEEFFGYIYESNLRTEAAQLIRTALAATAPAKRKKRTLH